MPKIKIITGSVRPNRFGPTITDWVYKAAQKRSDVEFEVVDLKEIDLPFFDEANPPMMGPGVNEHTKAWAKIIGEADGYIFVAGENNHSLQASLKNAIDYLYAEWHHKPLSIVSYGADAGGARAVEHIRQIVALLGLYDLETSVMIPNYWAQLTETGGFQPTDAQNQTLEKLLDENIFWTKALEGPRKELAEK